MNPFMVYNLTDHSISYPVENCVIIKHLNAALNDPTTENLKTFDLEELQSQYKTHKNELRSALATCNCLRNLLREAKEEIKDLKAKRSALMTEKDQAILNGDRASDDF
ncbi:hypothetical protein C5167_031298 [Papaver somniferum]|uniref:Uncharacterized protein n=1 Tax=Papaver somniferum TaxID=3469 RepID=A0A4Y7K3U9_PAPSO|nr:hypothetical protein C5167_031298 [Papaver somniferum]